MQDHRLFELGSHRLGPRRRRFDHLGIDPGIFGLDLLGQEQADIAAAEDQQPARLRFLVAEGGHRPRQLLGIDHEIGFVAGQHLVVGRRNDGPPLAGQTDDHRVEVGEDLGQLAQRCVDQRAALAAAHADQLHPVFGQRDHLEGAGHLEPAGDRAGNLDLGRDDDVDRHVLAREQGPEHGVEVTLVADPGDLRRHVEQGVRDLAGHHVDLVGLGHRDQDIGALGVGLLERVRMGRMADDALDVEAVADSPDQVGRAVDDRHVVAFTGQIARDVESDLPGPTNDDFHRTSSLVIFREFRPLSLSAGAPGTLVRLDAQRF